MIICSVFVMCCEYLLRVSVFGCVLSICSVFLYSVVLWVFAVCFCIWLCCEYLQRVSFGCEYLLHVSVFGCFMSICSVFLYLVAS